MHEKYKSSYNTRTLIDFGNIGYNNSEYVNLQINLQMREYIFIAHDRD